MPRAAAAADPSRAPSRAAGDSRAPPSAGRGDSRARPAGGAGGARPPRTRPSRFPENSAEGWGRGDPRPVPQARAGSPASRDPCRAWRGEGAARAGPSRPHQAELGLSMCLWLPPGRACPGLVLSEGLRPTRALARRLQVPALPCPSTAPRLRGQEGKATQMHPEGLPSRAGAEGAWGIGAQTWEKVPTQNVSQVAKVLYFKRPSGWGSRCARSVVKGACVGTFHRLPTS